MKAKVTKAFHGAADGQAYPQDWPVGTEISGDLARTAVANGDADMTEDDTDAEKAALAASGRVAHPLPPTPNNPPSPAALGQAGLPPEPQAYSQPDAGSAAAVAATATADGGASQVKGPYTPSGAKASEAAAEASGAEAESKGKSTKK